MTHYLVKQFETKLARFRPIANLSRADVCERLSISHKTYNRLHAAYRAETGKLTRNQIAEINMRLVVEYTGERDPQMVPVGEYAAALGITKGQATRCRSVLITSRAIAPPKTTPVVSHRVKKAERMFWVSDGRLFSKNREPAEVGQNA